jgi:hypothetical protein
MMKPKYLTKSRFKLALSCETKLFYTNRKDEYADQNAGDSFLEALAEGGFQVGELAKFLYCEDPVKEKITIETLDYNESLKETEERIREGKNLIAEAAFRFEKLFIRADLVRIFPAEKKLFLYEVKAKSYDSNEKFFSVNKKTGEFSKISPKWKEYLYDVAFQKWVIMHLYPGFQINAFLVLADKEATASVNGLNQFFKINKKGERTRVDVKEGITKSHLGRQILKEVSVDEEIRWIWENPVDTPLATNISFKEYVNRCCELYSKDIRVFTPIGKKCAGCEFKLNKEQEEEKKLKSGFDECWVHATGLDAKTLKKPLVTELWAGLTGGKSLKQELIEKQIYLLEQVTEELIAPAKESPHEGMSPLERRMLQVKKTKNKDPRVFLDKKGLKAEMESWVYPLHFIDFETTRVAIPFHAGRKPYEEIAFQFSHHIVEEDGSIRHAGQFISFEPGYFPNYDFVRELKRQLETDKGSIFRYHNHENTVLIEIYHQIEKDKKVADSKDLMAFIREITINKDKNDPWDGDRNMIDLYKLVLSYYYPPAAGGSNSLKYILPATIQSSVFLQKKYGKPVYGKLADIPSLNFDKKTWLEPENPYNPYKSLPAIFEDYDAEILDQLVEEFDEIREGGAAMTAYAKMQFTTIPESQREQLKKGLLKYCELDTLAMVMIFEEWKNQISG